MEDSQAYVSLTWPMPGTIDVDERRGGELFL